MCSRSSETMGFYSATVYEFITPTRRTVGDALRPGHRQLRNRETDLEIARNPGPQLH